MANRVHSCLIWWPWPASVIFLSCHAHLSHWAVDDFDRSKLLASKEFITAAATHDLRVAFTSQRVAGIRVVLTPTWQLYFNNWMRQWVAAVWRIRSVSWSGEWSNNNEWKVGNVTPKSYAIDWQASIARRGLPTHCSQQVQCSLVPIVWAITQHRHNRRQSAEQQKSPRKPCTDVITCSHH